MSQGVEWGLHCATLLAQVPDGALVRREKLAQHYGLPEPYLAKHLQALVRADVLRAVSGPRGGYGLARAPELINALDVVEAIEGSAPAFTCKEIRQAGTGALSPEQCLRPCVINSVMTQADNAWRSSLRSVTIADLTHRLPKWVRKHNVDVLTEGA
ncbi:Rrf2 family transcriptional regulator [Kitasatospora sp. NPDC048540]|uniref:RrF2 family transcriptional regulator n=1 Tax=unclassified Kitasatospora TaxID=2633591 RepID=UPI0011EA6843|nr:Rrf2 family transcriptional regulator [Kitasatospora sp. MBT63]